MNKIYYNYFENKRDGATREREGEKSNNRELCEKWIDFIAFTSTIYIESE